MSANIYLSISEQHVNIGDDNENIVDAGVCWRFVEDGGASPNSF